MWHFAWDDTTTCVCALRSTLTAARALCARLGRGRRQRPVPSALRRLRDERPRMCLWRGMRPRAARSELPIHWHVVQTDVIVDLARYGEQRFQNVDGALLHLVVVQGTRYKDPCSVTKTGQEKLTQSNASITTAASRRLSFESSQISRVRRPTPPAIATPSSSSRPQPLPGPRWPRGRGTGMGTDRADKTAILQCVHASPY